MLGLWRLSRSKTALIHNYFMILEKGDLVACYLTNTSEWETLMNWGVVLQVNPTLGDVLVVDNSGLTRWWPSRRWRILSKKSNKNIDLPLKIV